MIEMDIPQWATGTVPQVRTERLLLTAPNDGDREAIARLANNINVTRWLRQLPHPYTVEDAEFFLRDIVPVQAVWAIRLQWDEAFIGAVGLTPKEERSAELGYWLGEPFWGHGYATEAASAVLAVAHGRFGLATIQSGYYKGNEASANVLRKL
ncbi:MAG: GNAT family N-acetyltransferase, partial [Pseudomonadota bacterium]